MSTRTREPAARTRSPRPPVDPRVRERWIAARRAEGRRRLRWVVVILGLAALVVAAWGVSVSPLLDVDHLVVVGTNHATAAEIESAAGIHRGDALAWIDTSRAVDGIDALPYVRSARVEREWPDAVRIVVVERVGVAWVEGGGRRAVVDGSGRVLELVTDAPAGLPQLASTTTVPPVGSWIVHGVAGARVAAGLAGLAGGVQSIATTPAGVNLQLVNGPELRLGDPDGVVVKVRAATAVLAAMQGQVVHYVDVSVPTNPVAG